MENKGREPAKENDLFFTCSLIDYIARKKMCIRDRYITAAGMKRWKLLKRWKGSWIFI